MVGQLTRKMLNEELEERLTHLQKNKKVSPWYWAEKIEKMDDPLLELTGATFEQHLDFAFEADRGFAYTYNKEKGKLKNMMIILNSSTSYLLKEQHLKDGTKAMYCHICTDGIELDATQTQDGRFVGPFYFRDRQNEVRAFYDEKAFDGENQTRLCGKVSLKSKSSFFREYFISGLYDNGVPKKLKGVLSVPVEDKSEVRSETYENGVVAYAYDKSAQNGVREYFYDNGVLIKQKSLSNLAFRVKKTGKILAWAALGAAVCFGATHVAGSQRVTSPVQKQYQRG